jgi:glycosyltransferase involved in cell wall biosynthesis
MPAIASHVRPDSATRPLRVVYLGHAARLSGAEIGTLRLIKAAERVQATVLLAEDGPLVGALRDAGAAVEVLPLAERARGVHRSEVRLGLSQAAGALDVVRYVAALRGRIRALQPDLVHTISLKSAIYGSAAARLAGTPCLCHLQDRIAPDYLPARTVGTVRLILSTLPSAVVVPSRATLEAASGHFRRGLLTAVIPLPVPIPAQPFAVRDRVERIGIVGRLTPWKGQHVFLEAFARAFPQPNVQAVLIGSAMFGEDAYASELRAQARALGIEDRVEFAGFVYDVHAELERLDVLVHASVLPEPLGTVVIEGMAAGLPVLATNAGGPSEYIEDGRDGLLYPPGDAEALAAALERVASDRALRVSLSEEGRSKAREYAPEALVEPMLELYQDLAGGNRARR